MDGFVRKLANVLVDHGVAGTDIHYKIGVTALPGFFRPTKKWDMAVVVRGQLVAAIELKSQVGPSFGNNFNNRTEEAMGSALDLWTAYREGAYGLSPQPWLGYLFVLEDCDRSRSPVKVEEPHFSVFPDSRRASYVERYKLFCRRLVLERHYSAACLLLSERSRAESGDNYTEPDANISVSPFLSGLVARANEVAEG